MTFKTNIAGRIFAYLFCMILICMETVLNRRSPGECVPGPGDCDGTERQRAASRYGREARRQKSSPRGGCYPAVRRPGTSCSSVSLEQGC